MNHSGLTLDIRTRQVLELIGPALLVRIELIQKSGRNARIRLDAPEEIKIRLVDPACLASEE